MPEPLIRMTDVVKVYDSGEVPFTALRGINLDVGAGEFIGLIGKSGSGKTTLINMITGIDRPTSGTVMIGGTPVHSLNENQLAIWRGKNVGVVFQFFQLLPTLTVAENVMLPMDFCNVYNPAERPERATVTGRAQERARARAVRSARTSARAGGTVTAPRTATLSCSATTTTRGSRPDLSGAPVVRVGDAVGVAVAGVLGCDEAVLARA